jgi:putative transposase
MAFCTEPSSTSSHADGVLRSIKAIKGVKFAYIPTVQTRELLETFRDMVNDAIHICLGEGIRGRLRLRNRIYIEFQKKYGVISCYPYSVAEIAWSIVKKHRKWQRKPFAKRLMMKMDAHYYSLNYSILSLPYKKGERIIIPLQYGDYQRSFLMDSTLKRGSVTLTESAIIVSFSRVVTTTPPTKRIGVDLNEKSVVCSDGSRYDTSEVARLHTVYGVKRREFNRNHPQDTRLKKKYASSRREKERVGQVLHRVAKAIVEKAKAGKHGLVLERLKGIRYAHEKGNGEGKGSRRRIAQWPFRVLQAFIVYKAAWEGVPVEFVGAAGTSRTCNKCRYINRNLKPTEREWPCPSCGATLDRDLNAAINIERRGKIPCLGEVRPGAHGTHEAVKGNEMTTPILRAEALKSK